MKESKWFIVTNPICLGKLHPYPLLGRSSAEKTANIENDYHERAKDGLISEVVPLYAIPDREEDDVLKDIVGEPDCSECGGHCTGCNLRYIRFANRLAVCTIIFMILFFGLMFFTL